VPSKNLRKKIGKNYLSPDGGGYLCCGKHVFEPEFRATLGAPEMKCENRVFNYKIIAAGGIGSYINAYNRTILQLAGALRSE
jgi:hypothetical protein